MVVLLTLLKSVVWDQSDSLEWESDLKDTGIEGWLMFMVKSCSEELWTGLLGLPVPDLILC